MEPSLPHVRTCTYNVAERRAARTPRLDFLRVLMFDTFSGWHKKRKILYTQTIVLLACSLLNIIQLNDWSSHSQVKLAKFNTCKMIIIPKSQKNVPVNNSHLKVHTGNGGKCPQLYVLYVITEPLLPVGRWRQHYFQTADLEIEQGVADEWALQNV